MVGYLDFKPGLKTGSPPLQKSFPVKGSLGGPPHDAKWSAHLEISSVNSFLKFTFSCSVKILLFYGYSNIHMPCYLSSVLLSTV